MARSDRQFRTVAALALVVFGCAALVLVTVPSEGIEPSAGRRVALVEEADGLELSAFLSKPQVEEYQKMKKEQEELTQQLDSLAERAGKIQAEDTKVIVQVAPPGPPGPVGAPGVLGDKVSPPSCMPSRRGNTREA